MFAAVHSNTLCKTVIAAIRSRDTSLAESEQSMDVLTISDKNNDAVITRSELVAAFGAPPPKSSPAPAPKKKNGPFPKP